jgi:hypothetical protein
MCGQGDQMSLLKKSPKIKHNPSFVEVSAYNMQTMCKNITKGGLLLLI